jgi:phage shock protein A
MARAAIERAFSHDQLIAGFKEQSEEQKTEADNLRQALRKLDQKLSETRAHCEMIVAEHRRAKTMGRATRARQAVGMTPGQTIDRMKSKVRIAAAENVGAVEVLAPESLEDRFHALENEDKVEALLKEMKSRQSGAA